LHFCDYPPFEKDLDLHLNKPEIPFMQECFVPSLIEISQIFHFKRFFPIYKCKNSFPSCGPSRPLAIIICTSSNLHYVRKLSCKSGLFWLSGSWGENVSMTSPNFCIFVNISVLKRTWPFIWTILNFLYPRMVSPPPLAIMIWTNFNLHYVKKLWCKSELFWLSDSGFRLENFSMTPIPFLHFCDYVPVEEDLAFYLNNLEFPLPKDNLYQVWMKLAFWFCRRFFFFNINTCKHDFPFCDPPPPPLKTMIWTILNLHYRKLSCKYNLFWLSDSQDFYMTPSHFCDYLPFEEDLVLYLINLEFPFSKDDLHQVWLKLASWFSRRFLKMFIVFVLFKMLLSPLRGWASIHLSNFESPLRRMIWIKFG
jgi:hypothetical protein